MQPKDYQKRVLKDLQNYLQTLADARKKHDGMLRQIPDEATRIAVAQNMDFTAQAWNAADGDYRPHTNGLGEPLPDIYIKVPTGGGKTYLACHAIDLINRHYLARKTGLVLWIVPTAAIYQQTLNALRDRDHFYRQTLENASGDCVKICEKGDSFSPDDARKNLLILMLMLQSANITVTEKRKLFRDRDGFDDFFPTEDNYAAHEKMLVEFRNLDCFGEEDPLYGRQIITSLGNAVRTLKPLIIVDEGQKAYSPLARETICDFNPAFVLELSATPPKAANVLVKISGKELDDEEMIKLDIILSNKPSPKWQDTLRAAFAKREELEKIAIQYKQDGGDYIRPIVLIQVERTGANQRGSNYIHAENAREFLIEKCAVAAEQIAFKTSERDELKGLDLLSEDCAIRYIITQRALQEGWDCAFAYILATLIDPRSEISMTQIVGRILRQPYARKTGISALDESYVFTHRQSADKIVGTISAELKNEGLGDIAGRIAIASGGRATPDNIPPKAMRLRKEFKKFEGKIYLPQFIVRDGKGWRNLDYDADILGGIDWDKIRPSEAALGKIHLSEFAERGRIRRIGLPDKNSSAEEIPLEESPNGLNADSVFMAKQFADIIPNLWRAHEIADSIIAYFQRCESPEKIAANFIHIIEETEKQLAETRDQLACDVFSNLIKTDKARFQMLVGSGWEMPKSDAVKSIRQLVRDDNSPLRKNWFDYVPDESFDSEPEKAVAIYLDQQPELLWWYRNIVRRGYRIQGWKRDKIYPDFIAAKSPRKRGEMGSIHVLETKGAHLKYEDTRYKEAVFELCTQLATQAKANSGELKMDFSRRKVVFQVIYSDEWRNELNAIFG